MERDENSIKGFQEEYRWLSNFWPCAIVYEGLGYPSSEAAYQAAKLENPEHRVRFTTMTPSQAKRAGKTVKYRPDWDDVRLQVMYDICSYKFRNNPELRQNLLDTDEKYIEETNDWGDRYWGVCRGSGQNHLGKILMRIRGELRKQEHDSFDNHMNQLNS
jgi:hypothetical protein